MSECSHATRQHDTTGGCTRSHCLDCGADLTRPTPQPEPWTRPDYITRAELVAALFSAGHALGSDSLNGYGLKNIARKLADALESKGAGVCGSLDRMFGAPCVRPVPCVDHDRPQGGPRLKLIHEAIDRAAHTPNEGTPLEHAMRSCLRVTARRLRDDGVDGILNPMRVAEWLESEAEK